MLYLIVLFESYSDKKSIVFSNSDIDVVRKKYLSLPTTPDYKYEIFKLVKLSDTYKL